jgi:hypothetical protein
VLVTEEMVGGMNGALHVGRFESSRVPENQYSGTYRLELDVYDS